MRVMQYGVLSFCDACQILQSSIIGLIIMQCCLMC